MMILELKRFYYKKYVLYIIGVFIMLIGLAFVNKYVVQDFYENQNLFALDYYNVVSQTGPFLLTPILAIYLTADYEKNVCRFYYAYNISKWLYYGVKIITPIMVCCFIMTTISMFFLSFMEIPFYFVIRVVCLLMLDIVYFVLFVAILSLVLKKRMVTIFAGMGSVVIMSILNIIPLGKLTGKLYLLDGNSYLTYQITLLMDGKNISCGKLLLIQGMYITCLLMIYLLIIYVKEKCNGK